VTEKYLAPRLHKALALRRGAISWNTADDRAQAERLTIERCGDDRQAPCLLLSADGMLTIQIPKSRPITDIFMLTTEPEMSDADKARIGDIYREKDWRALARGARGWYPVANLPSEAAAVDAALASCALRDTDCRLHAISNFRVAAEK
jgi:adenylate cyclase